MKTQPPLHFRLLCLLAPLALPLQAAADGMRAIGSQRQLFLDESIIETMEHTRPRLNPAVKVTNNPIITRDKPWEGPDIRVGWVIFDQKLGKFRMRYSTGKMTAEGRDAKGDIIVKGEGSNQVCEAFSDDGVHWTKPELGMVEFNGSKANNILPDSARYSYFFQDLHDPDPSRRYKAHVRVGTTKDKGMTFDYYYSADAYHWIAYEKNPVINLGDYVGRWGPTLFLGWDPNRKTYAVHMENNLHTNSPYKRRSIGRAESPDMIHWSEPETILVADNLDYPDTEFYAMPAAFHEGWTFGFPWVFSTTNTKISPQFAFSRDGINYNRTYREPIIPLGDNGDFDSVTVYLQEGPLLHNNELYFYYTGTNWRSPEQLVQLGDKAMARVGLAKLPVEGFVSLEGARQDFSIVTTRSFSFTGDGLYLNLYAALQQWGAEPCQVKVELLDGRHLPLEGYTLADADAISTTGVNQRASWKGKKDVSGLAGQSIRLRIYFKNAKLYAFQFR